MINFTDTSRQVSDPGEDMLPPLRLSVLVLAWGLRSPNVKLPLRCLSSVSQLLHLLPALLTDVDTLTFLLTCNTPFDSIFSYRTSTSEKIDLTRVTKYLPLMCFSNAHRSPYNLLVENERPRLDSNQWLRSSWLDRRLLQEVSPTIWLIPINYFNFLSLDLGFH